jgi:hypothetical protein
MAVNYATKYESKIAKAFTLGSLTEAGINKDFNWAGVSAINVFGITTQSLNTYNKSATSNRYGTPAELQNVVQTMTLANDKSFSISIDRYTLESSNGAITAGTVLKMEIDEQVTPTIDAYRLDKMQDAAIGNGHVEVAAVNSGNAYSLFLKGQEALSNDKVPVGGRVAFVSYAFYSFLKLDSTFMLASEVAMKDRINGMVGMVDGVKIVPVPSSYLPSNVSYILVHPSATVAAEKLTEYIVRDNVQGFSGVVIEGRIIYDAFVIDQKVNGIYVHATAEISA